MPVSILVRETSIVAAHASWIGRHALSFLKILYLYVQLSKQKIEIEYIPL